MGVCLSCLRIFQPGDEADSQPLLAEAQYGVPIDVDGRDMSSARQQRLAQIVQSNTSRLIDATTISQPVLDRPVQDVGRLRDVIESRLNADWVWSRLEPLSEAQRNTVELELERVEQRMPQLFKN